MHKLSRRSIIKKTIQVGGSTLISRFLGIVREVLKIRYFGANFIISDAFIIAFKIPNTLRKVFAEGAMSAAFIPTLVSIEKKENWHEVNKLMSLMFLVFQGILLLLCCLIFWKAKFIIHLMVPGYGLNA